MELYTSLYCAKIILIFNILGNGDNTEIQNKGCCKIKIYTICGYYMPENLQYMVFKIYFAIAFLL